MGVYPSNGILLRNISIWLLEILVLSNIWYLIIQQHEWNWIALCWMKEVSPKKLHTEWTHKIISHENPEKTKL